MRLPSILLRAFAYTSILIFAGPLYLHAGMLQAIMGAGTTAASCADTSCTGFLICQNFQTPTTGYDNSETWTETCGTGNTCTPASTSSPLRGTQSLLFVMGASASASTYKTITASDEIYVHFMWSFDTDVLNNVVSIQNSATQLFGVTWNAVNNKLYYNGATLGSNVVNPGTYHIWLYYKIGTGANEINRAWVGTTSDFDAATLDYEITNGTSTAQANRIYLQASANGGNVRFDQILVRTTAIGDVCD